MNNELIIMVEFIIAITPLGNPLLSLQILQAMLPNDIKIQSLHNFCKLPMMPDQILL